ncbi:MAG: lipocalin family protein [Bacteroidia bacterium]
MKNLFLLIGLSFLLSACEREMPTDATPLADAIKDKNWLVIADSTVSSAGTVENNYNLLKDCEKDNLYQFKSTKSVMIDEGASKCNASDAQSKTIGIWAINESTKVLTLTSIEKVEFKISALTANQMVLISTESSNGITLTETVTFKAN